MWAAGVVPGDAAATITSSFEKVVLMAAVTDPVEMAVDSEGRVFVGERSGPVKMWDPTSERVEMVGYVPVRMTIEDGLLGFTLDPIFDRNGWVYIYYAPEDGGPQRLARWTFDGERLDPATEKILLEIPTQQNECCHSGGSLTFGPEGNLYLSTGDNSNPYPLGGSAMDERPGFEDGDAQRTSANSNDLRGKIIRIRPLPDGSYEIPSGNLFEGDSLHRPEIYTMGHRNPYRISVDAQTGWLYWGDVGIGNAPSEARGPWGWEEFNQAREPGFYGWPYFAGPNDAYRDYDRATETSGPYFDPDKPVNESPNNTGARELPPAQPAMIWYTYGPSEEYPEMGSGGMSAMGGPVYRYDESAVSPKGLPAYYDGSFFIYEWMRNWVQEVKFDDQGGVLEINPFLPGIEFARPGDMEIGPDGRLYVIEWGESFWGSNADAQVVRLDYHGSAGSPGPAAASAQPVPPDTSAARADAGTSSAADGAARPALEPPNMAAGVSLVWPPHGGIFEVDLPIPYEVRAEEGDVVVYPFSGHDTHEHPLAPVQGREGEVIVSRELTHVPDLHYVDRFAVLEARTPRGQAHRIVLRPRIVEAEHAADRRLAERETFGKHPAEPDFADAALTVMSVDAGGFLGYAPLNLTGIDTLVIRVKPMPGAVLEVRRDAPDGVLLAEIVADSLSGLPAGEGGVLHAGRLTGLPEGVQAAYRGWRDLHVPVSGAGATERLYLLVRDAPAEGLAMRVDRLELRGPGVSKRPE
jgi:glucose/arabinose dehydrogenase